MAGMSNDLEDKILDHTIDGTSWAQPSAVYVSLHSADPTETGTTGEIAGGSYARQTPASWAAASGGSKATSADTTWTNMPATTVTHCAIHDHSDQTNATNVLYHGSLTASKVVGSGDTFKFTSGNLTVTLD
jgi:hypothetical protein